MEHAADDLHASGVPDGVLQPGTALPPFDLADTGGKSLRAEELSAKGRLVVSF
ncbi:MAG: hypothetical protein ACI8QS_002390 [Planctomycetota bacterium]|jgi:hypothetical protein